jgi:formylmethanofuran dehydrogenase subunit E
MSTPVHVLLGCTAGKGNLHLRNYGNQVYTFICRDSGHTVRIAVNPSMVKRSARQQRLRKKSRKEERRKLKKRYSRSISRA